MARWTFDLSSSNARDGRSTMPRSTARTTSRKKAIPGTRHVASTRRVPTVRAASSHAVAAMAVLQQFRELFRVSQQHFQRVESSCGVSGAQLWALSGRRHAWCHDIRARAQAVDSPVDFQQSSRQTRSTGAHTARTKQAGSEGRAGLPHRRGRQVSAQGSQARSRRDSGRAQKDVAFGVEGAEARPRHTSRACEHTKPRGGHEAARRALRPAERDFTRCAMSPARTSAQGLSHPLVVRRPNGIRNPEPTGHRANRGRSIDRPRTGFASGA